MCGDDGGSPRHSNTFSTLVYCCCTLHTYQYIICILLLLLTAPIQSQLQLAAFELDNYQYI